MTEPFPHRYETSLKLESDHHGIISAAGLPSLVGGPPSQFGGREGWWSPEHLLLSSANLCLMTTFLAVAEKSRLSVDGYESRAEGILDKTPDGIVFTRITLRVSVKVAAAEKEKAERLLQTAKKYCIVSNSLKNPIVLEATITE